MICEVVWLFWTAPIVNLRGAAQTLKGRITGGLITEIASRLPLVLGRYREGMILGFSEVPDWVVE